MTPLRAGGGASCSPDVLPCVRNRYYLFFLSRARRRACGSAAHPGISTAEPRCARDCSLRSTSHTLLAAMAKLHAVLVRYKRQGRSCRRWLAALAAPPLAGARFARLTRGKQHLRGHWERERQRCHLPPQAARSGWSPRWRALAAAAALLVLAPVFLLGSPALLQGRSALSLQGASSALHNTVQQGAAHLDAGGAEQQQQPHQPDSQPAAADPQPLEQPVAEAGAKQQEQHATSVAAQEQQQEQQHEPQPELAAQVRQQQEQQPAATAAGAPSVCSAMCSLGRVKPYVGEVDTNDGLAALLAASSYDKEVGERAGCGVPAFAAQRAQNQLRSPFAASATLLPPAHPCRSSWCSAAGWLGCTAV